MPLVLASGTHFAVGAIYRTLIESHIKIELKGSTGTPWFGAAPPQRPPRVYRATEKILDTTQSGRANIISLRMSYRRRPRSAAE
jgi:hypothetical protein